MTQNKSDSTTDNRVINQVIYEKALLGKVPAYFQIEGDPRFHPCSWQMHPHLTAVVFSDGTTSHVTAVTPSDGVAEKVGPVPGKYGYDSDYTTPAVGKPDVYAETEAETATESVGDTDYQISTDAIAKLFSPER